MGPKIIIINSIIINPIRGGMVYYGRPFEGDNFGDYKVNFAQDIIMSAV